MSILSNLLGGGIQGIASAVTGVVEVFKPNSEKSAARQHEFRAGAQKQYGREFGGRGLFNNLMDGINRIPRPAMALGVIWLLYQAMYKPVQFQEAMIGLALVPVELWSIIGIVITFYFGGKWQAKKIEAASPDQVAAVVQSIKHIRTLRPDTPGIASDDSPDAIPQGFENPVIKAWRG